MIHHKDFSSSPDFGKIAVDGKWEEAIVYLPGQLEDKINIFEYVKNRNEVACEAFFGKSFFGMRKQGSESDLANFIFEFSKSIEISQDASGFFDQVSKFIDFQIAEKFLFAEVGAVDAWNNIGAYKIVDPVKELSSLDQLLVNLSKSNVGIDHLHDKAIEFAYANGDGTTHWVALSVSQNNDISELKLEEILNFYQIRHNKSLQ